MKKKATDGTVESLTQVIITLVYEKLYKALWNGPWMKDCGLLITKHGLPNVNWVLNGGETRQKPSLWDGVANMYFLIL